MTKMINPAPRGWRGRGWIPGVHRGTDFGFYNADPDGTKEVVVVADGTVIHESYGGGNNDGWGNQYIVDHGHGIYTTYNHFATGTMQVDVGQFLAAGTYLGQMGDTGNADGEHLHFEVRINGWGADNRVDPGPWLSGSKEIPGTPAASGAAVPITADQTTKEDDMAGLIQHKDRGIALIAPGYFKAVTPEELPIAVSRYGWPKIYDDSQVGAREFDLDVSLAVNGAGGDQQVRSELERSRDAVLKAITGMRGSV